MLGGASWIGLVHEAVEGGPQKGPGESAGRAVVAFGRPLGDNRKGEVEDEGSGIQQCGRSGHQSVCVVRVSRVDRLHEGKGCG